MAHDVIDQQEKRTGESVLYDFDFSDHGAISERGATIAGVLSVTFTPPTDPVLNVGSPSHDGKSRVQVRIDGGLHKTRYFGVCKATTSLGDTIQMEGMLYVYDPI